MKQVVFIIALFCTTNIVLGCTCISLDTSARKSLKLADVVILAKITSRSIVKILDEGPPEQNVYTYEVIAVFKGRHKKKSKQIKLFSGLGSGDCGYLFKTGHVYLVYADYGKHLNGSAYNSSRGYLYTDICHDTQPYSPKAFYHLKRGLSFWRRIWGPVIPKPKDLY
jgi:hypothetical protein